MAAVMAESSVPWQLRDSCARTAHSGGGEPSAHGLNRGGRATGSEKRTRKPDAPTVQWQGTCDGGAQREEARRGEDCIDDGVGHRRAGGIRNKERNVPPLVGRDEKLELEASKASWRVARISLVKCGCE